MKRLKLIRLEHSSQGRGLYPSPEGGSFMPLYDKASVEYLKRVKDEFLEDNG